MKKKYLLFIIYLLVLLSTKAQITDSIPPSYDSRVQELQEIEVTAQKQKKAITGLLSGKIMAQYIDKINSKKERS